MAVYAKQYGRTGNNLFQKAAAIGYAMKHGHDYNLCPWNTKNTISFGGAVIIKEAGHAYQELMYDKEWAHRRIVLDGYWQSEKYFAHYREEVISAFRYQWMPLSPDTCAIHVRRGDYLNYPDKHPAVTEEYLNAAINHIKRHVEVERFIFFSDDIAWCKSYKQSAGHIFWGYDAVFSEDRTEKEDLELMSSCQHQIISNSTFSWWGAWLNQNQNKVVISPSKNNWFGPGNAHLDASDLIPDSWIQIKY